MNISTLVFINSFFMFLQLIQSEEHGKAAKVQESSSEGEEDDDEEDGSGDEGSGDGSGSETVKTSGMKRALIVRLVPRRLISSYEIMLVRTLTPDVIVETVNLYTCGLRAPF
jgi:hypothetical protein